ncbi:hypothetical protein PORCRE_923 [Porphyromonas crevioricanis JCM 15906]|uniref:Uncharacterized protein n=1 Tax=Porphyromonas crevioricanis JCM 15906 TaxID=1305617 RepID=T1CQ69_9PORP|nr:hypothetical protein PORCRE_923 [Porphyromonas crevioricanis JCM 15906]GAD06443.1 hypothetical protein PORCAN_39 [Porphyromonas crevioricanis JCM 13913]
MFSKVFSGKEIAQNSQKCGVSLTTPTPKTSPTVDFGEDNKE